MLGQSTVLLEKDFPPDSYLIIKVTKDYNEDSAPGSLAGLYFDGVFTQAYFDPHATVLNMINLDVLKVYFTNREPTEAWGYPTQMDDLYEDLPV